MAVGTGIKPGPPAFLACQPPAMGKNLRFSLFCVLTPFQGAKGHYAEGKRTAALAAIQKPAPVGTVSETPLEAILETLSRRVSPRSSQDWFPR